MTSSTLSCVRCGQPVLANRAHFELFERRHWLCFHLDFEHSGDPDQPCTDPSCPWWRIGVLEAELRRLGADPDAVLRAAVKGRHC